MCSVFFSSSELSWNESIHLIWCMIHRGHVRNPKFTVWNGPERTNFVEGSLPWRSNAVNLKGVSHGEWKHYVIQCRGIERSQIKQFCVVYRYRVLKWVNLMINHRGLERSQFLMICNIGPCDGLERSQLLQCAYWSWNESICTNFQISSEGSWKEFKAYCWKPVWLLFWLISPVCMVLGVTFPAIELKVWVWVLCWHHGIWWRLVQTDVSSCL